ncbi:MAG: glutamate racemase [Deltaproteobacteria bacterium]|nr:glutamate racemase [Deltaproteobacteria bacterium]
MRTDKERPIGVFDSGIGGLTVLREITRLLPSENTIYLGDTARVPYGNKSKDTVARYSLEIADFLVRKGVKMIVVACNTASAFGLAELRKKLAIPVIGVIEPGAKAAVKATRSNKVGVIGTEGTIKSSAYVSAIKTLNPDITTNTAACPLFVPLAEEGWIDNEVTTAVAKRYLTGLMNLSIDTLVLGCTHYPVLKETISMVVGPSVTLIDSAASTAEETKTTLADKGILNDNKTAGGHFFYVTDSPERFVAVGRRFFGERLEGVEITHLDTL